MKNLVVPVLWVFALSVVSISCFMGSYLTNDCRWLHATPCGPCVFSAQNYPKDVGDVHTQVKPEWTRHYTIPADPGPETNTMDAIRKWAEENDEELWRMTHEDEEPKQAYMNRYVLPGWTTPSDLPADVCLDTMYECLMKKKGAK